MKKEYWINVKHGDNRLVIFLNGETVWDSGIVHGDPGMDHFIDITENLKAHPEHTSELIFEGFNDSYTEKNDSEGEFNPWHFNYRVFKRDVNEQGSMITEKDILAPYDEKHLSNPNIKAIENTYQIILKNDEYKVISNSLSQHFYQ
jgi:hypothetical protein